MNLEIYQETSECYTTLTRAGEACSVECVNGETSSILSCSRDTRSTDTNVQLMGDMPHCVYCSKLAPLGNFFYARDVRFDKFYVPKKMVYDARSKGRSAFFFWGSDHCICFF